MSPQTDNPFTVVNPVKRGSKLTVPAGTVVHSTNPSKRQYVLKRAQTVLVHHAPDGWIDTVNHFGQGDGYVSLPTISWAGTGGYWCDVQVTPEVAAANGLELPTLPGQGGKVGWVGIDVIPSYEDGYCNRWTA